MEKLLSVFMTLVMAVSTLFPAAVAKMNNTASVQLPELSSVQEYIDYMQENGVTAMTTDVFFDMVQPAAEFRRLITGKTLSEETSDAIDVALDETLSGLCGYIAQNTGLDIERLLTHLPSPEGSLADRLAQTLNVDTDALRQEVFRLSDDARADGHTLLATALYSLAMYFSIASAINIYTVPSAAAPGEVDVLMDVTYKNGTAETINPDITINPETGYAHHNNNENGIMGTGFDVDIYDLVLYTTVNSWQRNYGFSLVYDIFSASSPLFNYVTRRFRFEYGGKEWMLQIWKGNYGLATNGAEVGLYNRAAGSVGSYYNCVSDDEMVPMSMTLSHGDETLLSRGPVTHWWLTAFKMSRTLYLPHTLTLEFSVTLPDREMLNALASAINANAVGDVSFTVDGLTLTGLW